MREKGFLGERRGEVGCSTENNSLACLSTSELENDITSTRTQKNILKIEVTQRLTLTYVTHVT